MSLRGPVSTRTTERAKRASLRMGWMDGMGRGIKSVLQFCFFNQMLYSSHLSNQNWYNTRWGSVLFYVIFWDIFDRIFDFFRDNNAHFHFFVDILL